jgi:hypothetical protein
MIQMIQMIQRQGLQNASVVRQRSDIAACHGLYNVVFAALGLSKML